MLKLEYDGTPDAEDIYLSVVDILDDFIDDDGRFSYESTLGVNISLDNDYVSATHGNVRLKVDADPEDDVAWDIAFTFEDGTPGFTIEDGEDLTWEDVAERIK